MSTRRFESIGNILSRNVDPSTSADDDELQSPVSTTGPPRPAVTELRATSSAGSGEAVTPKRQQRGAASGSTGGVRRIAFRLDPDLHTALTAQAAAVKTSHGQIVLDSVEAAHTNGVLADLVAEENPEGQTEGMFPRLVDRGPAQPTVPVEIRLHARAVAVLDQLVQDTTAQSRTQLIVAALRHHLNSRSDP